VVNLNFSRSAIQIGFLLATLVLVWLLMPSALAQTTISTGSIVGTVTDASGALLPGAKVTITGPTGQIVTTTTGTEGGYSAGHLIPGGYKVRIEAKGFKTAQLPLDVKVDSTVNGNVKLEVVDHGIGIPPHEQQKIFEKFYRVGDPLVHNTKGSGLGLSLVRHIVQAHGGEVSVDSAPGQGSKFTISLPVRLVTQPISPAISDEAQEPKAWQKS